jgi:multicomponent K+:H+ antiporter subunit E
MIGRALPYPTVSALLFVTWLALVRSLEPLQVLGALVIAVGVPLVTARLLEEPVAIVRPLVAARFAILVIGDIVVANWIVARLVLGRISRLRPSFVVVPLDTSHSYTNVLLANVISMTPGTVSVEVDERRGRIVVHVLDLHDGGELVARIKTRYERPLKEVFGWQRS